MFVVTLDPSALSSSRNENEEAVKIRMCIAKIGLEIWPAQLPENKKKHVIKVSWKEVFNVPLYICFTTCHDSCNKPIT